MQEDFFVEVFPINYELVPDLYAYKINFANQDDFTSGGRIAYQINLNLDGNWIWAHDRLLSDKAIPLEQLQDFVSQDASISADSDWMPTADIIGQYMLRAIIRPYESQIRSALAHYKAGFGKGEIQRDASLSIWDVDGLPSLGISIQSSILYKGGTREYIQSLKNPNDVVGLWVRDKLSSLSGEIIGLIGPLKEHRQRLIDISTKSIMKTFIAQIPNEDEPILEIKAGAYRYHYPASALKLIIRSHVPEDMERFQIPYKTLMGVFQLTPDMRSKMIRQVSDVLKSAEIISAAYNARQNPELFNIIDFMPNLKFADQKVFAYSEGELANHFIKGGVYKKYAEFEEWPIEIAVINTLSEKVDDFIEALRRQLERQFGYKIEINKERKVRVLSPTNLTSAVRVVEKETPHIVLAFLEDTDNESDEESYNQHLKSQLIGKGIASHIIRPRMMHNPDSMTSVLMAILGKTGNIPFVLAEPLEYCDYVIGLDLQRKQKSELDQVSALIRIYKSDGEFISYRTHNEERASKAPISEQFFAELFPIDLFEGKRLVIHHNRALEDSVIIQLLHWASERAIDLSLVEINDWQAPRIYNLEKKKVVNPPWGSLFRINDHEALLVSTTPSQKVTTKPLLIKLLSKTLTIEQAVYSTLAWTLLYYGSHYTPKLPVTIQYANEINLWLDKGLLTTEAEGDMPFWL